MDDTTKTLVYMFVICPMIGFGCVVIYALGLSVYDFFTKRN